MRTTLIALRLAEQVGMSEDERSGLYYASLIAWVGCHIDAYEQAKWFGDDTVLKGDVRRVDIGRTLPSAAFTIKHLGAGRPFHARVRLGLSLRDGGWVRAMDHLARHSGSPRRKHLRKARRPQPRPGGSIRRQAWTCCGSSGASGLSHRRVGRSALCPGPSRLELA